MEIGQFIRKTCENKCRYETRGEALGAKAQIERKERTAVNVYKCQFCGAYHVGRASAQEQEQAEESRNSKEKGRKQKYNKRERRTGRLANYAAHKLGGDCSPAEIEEIVAELENKKH